MGVLARLRFRERRIHRGDCTTETSACPCRPSSGRMSGTSLYSQYSFVPCAALSISPFAFTIRAFVIAHACVLFFSLSFQ